MAEENAGNAGKKGFPLIMVIVVIVVAVAAAGGISYLVASKLLKSQAKPGGETAGKEEHADPGVFYPLGDAKEGFIVNIGGPASNKMLKINIVLELDPEFPLKGKDPKQLGPAEFKMRDAALSVLRQLKLDDLDPAKEDKLKATLRDKINEALGTNAVWRVYITGQILQ
ncbi:MAG: flagellar basal body-associated FliL family protein [Negativicutes bacterium]|nr:flagellar basal body-associated FliL family protein [Negativicutes bacterium]